MQQWWFDDGLFLNQLFMVFLRVSPYFQGFH